MTAQTIEGTLAERGVGALFKALSARQQTGVIEISGRKDAPNLHIYVQSSQVVHLSYAKAPADRLGQRLLQAQLIDQRALRSALRTQAASRGTPLGEILLAQGQIDSTTLRHFLRLQLRERMGALFDATQGSYRFSEAATIKPPSAPRLEALSVHQIIAEGERRAESWPLILTKVPSSGAVFKRSSLVTSALEPVESGATAIRQLEAAVLSRGASGLSRAEKHVLALLDGRRSVAQLSHLSYLGYFDTCRVLFALTRADRVVLVRKGSETKIFPSPASRRLARAAGNLVFWLALGAGAGLLTLRPLPEAQTLDFEAVPTLTEPRAARRLQLEMALEIERLKRGAYPEHLEALVERGLVEAPFLEPPDGRPWIYRAAQAGYELR